MPKFGEKMWISRREWTHGLLIIKKFLKICFYPRLRIREQMGGKRGRDREIQSTAEEIHKFVYESFMYGMV